MEIIFIGLIIIIVIFGIKNIVLIKDLLISKKFRKIYTAVTSNDPDVINKIDEYLKDEKNEYLINKTYVLLMYIKLQNNDDVKEELDKVNFEKIFLKNGKYIPSHVNLCSDMFIWIICMLPRLKTKGYFSLIKDKMNSLNDILDKHIEYKVFNSAFSLLDGDQDNSSFLDALCNGEYSNLEYDKQLIGVVKRIALSYIASKNKEKNIEYVDELKILSQTMIGKNILSDLGIYEVYK